MDRNRLPDVKALYADLEENPFFWALVWRIALVLALVGVCWLMRT